VTLRKAEGQLVVSSRDWGIAIAVEWGDGEKYTPKIRAQVIAAIEGCWLRVAEEMRRSILAGAELPDAWAPARPAPEAGRRARPLTVSDAARLLGISENSVRRIPRSALRFKRTKGGHRRYEAGAIAKYKGAFAEAPAGGAGEQ
jgi:hypothetical protein